MIIQNNAIFIADSHYNRQRTQLNNLLLKIQNNEIKVTQIILMGDIFDFLADEIEYFKFINYKITSLINDLSLTHEVIYFEGNHDFNLKNIFPSLNIITRINQPLVIEQDDKKIALAHGDIFVPKLYDFYTNIIRNHYFINCINFLDVNNMLSQYVEKKLIKKRICHKQNNFLHFVHNRIKNYNLHTKNDLIIEGHYHQGYISNAYINIPSLACDNRYMIYQNNQFSFNIL
jgi:UDP-2,3-diacylglucosamine hydrolase